MNKPKPRLKQSISAVINKRTLSSDQTLPQTEFTPDQLREIAFRCERALTSPVQPAALEFDEWE
jgi:hypothetical protein